MIPIRLTFILTLESTTLILFAKLNVLDGQTDKHVNVNVLLNVFSINLDRQKEEEKNFQQNSKHARTAFGDNSTALVAHNILILYL